MNERERIDAIEAAVQGDAIFSVNVASTTLRAIFERIHALEAALLAITQIQGATPDSKSPSLYPVALYNARQIAADALATAAASGDAETGAT